MVKKHNVLNEKYAFSRSTVRARIYSHIRLDRQNFSEGNAFRFTAAAFLAHSLSAAPSARPSAPAESKRSPYGMVYGVWYIAEPASPQNRQHVRDVGRNIEIFTRSIEHAA